MPIGHSEAVVRSEEVAYHNEIKHFYHLPFRAEVIIPEGKNYYYFVFFGCSSACSRTAMRSFARAFCRGRMPPRITTEHNLRPVNKKRPPLNGRANLLLQSSCRSVERVVGAKRPYCLTRAGFDIGVAVWVFSKCVQNVADQVADLLEFVRSETAATSSGCSKANA